MKSSTNISGLEVEQEEIVMEKIAVDSKCDL